MNLLTQSEQRTQRAFNKRALIIGAAALAIISLIILVWRFRSTSKAAEGTADESSVVVGVRAAKAERKSIAAEVSAVGTIFPREQATVSAGISGQIKQMRILKNAVVKAGETIAIINSRDLTAQRAEAAAALQEARLNLKGLQTSSIPQAEAQVEKDLHDAQANVNNAQALYERRRALYQKGGIALKDLQDAQLALTTAENGLRLAESAATLRKNAASLNELAVAQARVQQAEQHVETLDAQLSFAAVRAPIAGVVTDQFQFEGEYAATGARLATIADISEVIVKAQFADTVVADLKAEDAADVLPSDLPGERLSGKIALISRSSDPQNRAVEVWVRLGNGAGRLRPGGAARVVIGARRQTDAVVVPPAAVILDASNEKTGAVMVVDAQNVAHETKVEIGISGPDFVQIVSGLQGGETVIIEGNYALPDGAKVEIESGDENGKEKADDKEGGDKEGGDKEGGDKEGGDKDGGDKP